MSTELLSVERSGAFVSKAMKLEVQVLSNRRDLRQDFGALLAGPGDKCFEWSAEKYDKLMTFLSQNDQQVHYAGDGVNIYAYVKLLAELRRLVRALPGAPASVTPGSPAVLGLGSDPPLTPITAGSRSFQPGVSAPE